MNERNRESMAPELQVHRPTIAKREANLLASPVREDLVGRFVGKRYLLRTYGCQMNEHDTEIMAGLLEQMGYQATGQEEEADLILFNTCAVRENAENKVFGEIGRVRPLKARNPELLLGVCGCMPQEKAVQDKVQKTYPWVDLVFGTHNLHRLPELVESAIHSQETVMEVWDHSDLVIDELPKVRQEGVRAFVNIQYGCNKFCTYCIVPFTRGRERSRTIESIVKEVRELIENGYRDITLLGQNVNDYGLDLDTSFAQLLREVGKIDGVERIRFTTSNPWNFTDDLIEAIASTPSVCEHIHLPVQSGSNRILKAMNRGYTTAYYQQLIAKIRHAIPSIALTTDLIVGFPGETQEDFEATLDLVREVQYDTAYTFIYSPRQGTPAATMTELVDPIIAKERLQRLMDVQNVISRDYNEKLIGSVVEVLVEGPSRTNPDVLQGRTRTNKLVHIKREEGMMRSLVMAKIDAANTWTLKGSVLR